MSCIDKPKIRRIYKKSREIFKKCSLENGAIIAADVFDKDYPKDVKWYGYVWPRDASFVCYACDLIGLHEIPEKFFKWCWEYAEGLKENGIFLAQKYYPNGRVAGDSDNEIRTRTTEIRKLSEKYRKLKWFYIQTQYDHSGLVLWAIYEHSNFEDVSGFKEMIKKIANGICDHWKKYCFKLPSHDLWEERVAYPNLRQVHIFTLATCIKGLECASSLLGKREGWQKTIKEMKDVLEKSFLRDLGHFVRISGTEIDKTVDSSLFGLVWPTQQFSPNDERIVSTVNKILSENEVNGGIYRYKGDKYCGKIEFGDLKLSGGGSWPILNFWASIYFSLKGEKEKALKYFNWVIERVEEKIPEQIKNNKPSSIIPLTWSHAMFVIAGKFLNLF
ncbi:MAG: glycoside hydrolase family 15 protein [Candidatus Aenigmatarchaeota archaeon]